jgi:hypothetical protein
VVKPFNLLLSIPFAVFRNVSVLNGSAGASSPSPTNFPPYRNPKTKPEAKANIQVLIAFLKKKQAEGSARRVMTDDIIVGAWIKKFTAIKTGPIHLIRFRLTGTIGTPTSRTIPSQR